MASKAFGDEKLLVNGIRELKQLIELAKPYPVLWWVYGDDESGDEEITSFTARLIKNIPDDVAIDAFLKLPHMRDLFSNVSDKANKARYKNAEAAYNRQRKIEAKNLQRQQTKVV